MCLCFADSGTWDELFEIAVERVLGFSQQPLCLINVDGYYDGIIQQMERAQKDQILYSQWRQMVHVVATAEEALERSEEHTSELQSLMRISYAVFCLKKKKTKKQINRKVYK